MKKVLFLFLFIPLVLLAIPGCDPEDGEDGAPGPQGQQGEQGEEGEQGDDGLTPVVELVAIMVGEEPCAENGGNTVVVTTGTNVQMIDICNPADGMDGPAGPPGVDAEPITTAMAPAELTDCPNGGTEITIMQGGMQVGDPVIICDGEDGTNLELACADLMDNDGDSLTDCADPDCSGQLSIDPNDPLNVVACQATESNCIDGFDNDGDGDIDRADTDCFGVIEGSVICGPGLFEDIEAEFFIFDVNQCSCDFTTFDDMGMQLQMILDVSAYISFSLAICEVDIDESLGTATTFDITINCENTISGVMDDPVTVMGCSVQ